MMWGFPRIRDPTISRPIIRMVSSITPPWEKAFSTYSTKTGEPTLLLCHEERFSSSRMMRFWQEKLLAPCATRIDHWSRIHSNQKKDVIPTPSEARGGISRAVPETSPSSRSPRMFSATSAFKSFVSLPVLSQPIDNDRRTPSESAETPSSPRPHPPAPTTPSSPDTELAGTR